TYGETFPEVPPPATAFSALVDWGDGTTAPATVREALTDCYEVSANTGHGYAEHGNYTVSYRVHDSTTGLEHILRPQQFRVFDSRPQLIGAARRIYATAGIPWHGVIGEVEVESPLIPVFSSRVEWHAGRPSVPAVIEGSHERLVVTARLIYGRPYKGVVSVVM